MKEIIAYEMESHKTLEYKNDIICDPFQEKYVYLYVTHRQRSHADGISVIDCLCQ